MSSEAFEFEWGAEFVAFTERQGRIRIISARKATRRERKDYEEREE